MRRNELLTCTDLTLDQYVSMVRRDLLPYLDREGRGWADYSARQVFFTALTVALAPSAGGQRAAAQLVVDLPEPEFSARVWPAIFRPERGEVWLVGQRFLFVERGAAAVTLPTSALSDDTVQVINLTAVMQQVRSRAAASGIVYTETADV